MRIARTSLFVAYATLAAFAPSLAGCGAKTGLLDALPTNDTVQVDASLADVPIDADALPDTLTFDVADAETPFACITGTFPLTPVQAELVLLLDRSGSMEQNLDGLPAPPRKWTVLHDSLATTLPTFESQLRLGAMAFPRKFDGSTTRSCVITRALDVEPALETSRAILAILESTDPWGSTPTNDALQFTGNLLQTRVSRIQSEAIVLATDGGPNCNPTLDPATCPCTATLCSEASGCLDQARTVDTIAALNAKGVPTYVIGLDGTALTDERGALEAMAKAGGHPNPKPGGPSYYSVRDPSAVTAAFQSIQTSVVRCTLVLPSRPDDPNAVSITADGVPVARDLTHANGWDWVSLDFGQVQFFGAACDKIASPTVKVVGTVDSCKG